MKVIFVSESNNITEIGEGKLVDKLHSDYEKYLNYFEEIKNENNPDKSEYRETQ